jgi:NAD(P)H-dependent FMN reductase
MVQRRLKRCPRRREIGVLVLKVITVSTRPGRIGPLITGWFRGFAEQHGGFKVEVIDLAEVDLPLFDEPNHPLLRQYEHDYTKAWSKSISSADAFVIVTPEYNYFTPPTLVNALDYLSHEWNYKPAGLVSYGGLSGGLRAAQAVKPLLSSLKIVPLPEGVAIPFVTQHLNEAKTTFHANEMHELAATKLLDELKKWATVLQPLHNNQ